MQIIILAVLLSGLMLPAGSCAAEDSAVAAPPRANRELMLRAGGSHRSVATHAIKTDGSHDERLDEFLAGLSRHGGQGGPQESLRLSLRDVLNLALTANRDVQLAALNPLMSEAELNRAKTVYDPTFFTDSGYYKTDRPIASLLDNGTNGTTGKDSLNENGWSARTGLRQPLPTGGTATLLYEADHLNSNSELVIPNPQYTSRLKLELRQSLLKEIGDRTNRTNIELAELGVEQAASDYRKSISVVLRELATYYWRYKYYYELEQLSRKAVREGEEILARLRARHEQGIADLLDLDRADSSLQERKVQLVTDCKSTRTTLDQLKMLLGFSPSSANFSAIIEPAEPFRTSVRIAEKIVLDKTALTRRVEVDMARRNLQSTALKRNLAEHLKLPTVDLKTGYWQNGLGRQWDDSFNGSTNTDQNSWNIGVVIEWPLGGRKSSMEHLKADITNRQALIEYQKVMEKVLSEVNSSSVEVKLSVTEVETADKAKGLYKKVLEREKALFEMSRIDNQHILDTEDKYNNAAKAYLRALFNLNTAALNLEWAQGTLLESLEINL